MTKPIDNSGDAFPMNDSPAILAYAAAASAGIEDVAERDRVYLRARREAVGGLTVRQYFAARAPIAWDQAVTRLQHLGRGSSIFHAHAELCFIWADAMIAAGAQPPKEI